jgi:hypothetical protein
MPGRRKRVFNSRTTKTVAPAVTAVHSQAHTYLWTFRGVHKQYRNLYVATYEAMVNTKRVASHLIRRMCVCNLAAYPDYT